jgi:hypothetical protein
MVVGNTITSLWVRGHSVDNHQPGAREGGPDASAFTLELDINGTKASFTLAELEKDPAYVEAVGSYTTSAGTKYTNRYGGVRLKVLLDRYMNVSADDSITFVAMDGYEMTYPGSRGWTRPTASGSGLPCRRGLPAQGSGVHPHDQGGTRGTEHRGTLSVRMVKKIVVKEKEFHDFS